MLFAINYLSVFVYGILIMIFLLDIKMNKKNLVATLAYIFIGIIFHISLYFFLGEPFLEKSYPLVVHFPLLIFFCLFFEKRLDNVIFVLCTAYILTTPRRWVGDLIALAFHNDPNIAAIIQVIVTIPLLFIIYKYLRPYIIKVLVYSDVKIRFLLVIPLIYYVVAYLTTVYTQLLYTSRIVVIGILTIGLTATFYYFFIVYFNEMEKKFELVNEQSILAVQISALHARAETMKLAEESAIILRHDLRHHLQLINGYLIEDNVEEARRYLSVIEKNMYQYVATKYCDNDAVNLILSSYIGMAKNEGLTVQSHVSIPKTCEIADIDLCVILANAIENAIHACINIKDSTDRTIHISCLSKNHKLLIQITNSFDGVVTFKNDMPVTDEENHGFGTKSIVATVQKYKGIYSFTTEEHVFKMNIIL